MSYSMTVGPLTKPLAVDDVERLLQAEADRIPDSDGTPAAEIREHIEVAARVVVDLAKRLGQNEDRVSISIAGHAEPGHGQRQSWSPEMMHVSVSVLRRESTPAA